MRLGQPATTLSGGEAQRDLGPEGGEEGGRVIATGTPEQVALVPESYTGRFLAEIVPVAAKAGRDGRKPTQRPAPRRRTAAAAG